MMLAALKMLSVFVVLGTVSGVVGIPYSLITGNLRALYDVVMGIMRAGISAAGIRVEVTGRHNVPVGVSCIFVANHLSNLDPPILFPELPAMTSVLLKQELMRIPLLGTAMRLGKFVPIERTNTREGARRTMAAASAVLASGMHMLVFPEGTRSPDGRLGEFKKGPFFLAQHSQSPIVPVAISGTERMMRRGSFVVRPGVAKVTFLPPIDAANYRSRNELVAAVRHAIAEALPENMQPAQDQTAA